MSVVWLWASGLLVFAVGLGVGLYLRRLGRVSAALEARAAAEAEVSELRALVSRGEARLEEVAKDLAHTEAQLEAARERVVTLSTEVGEARAGVQQLEAVQAVASRREQELDRMQQDLALEQAARARAEARVEGLHREAQAQEAELAANEAELELVRTHTARLAEQYARAGAELAAQTRRADEAAQGLAAAQTRIQALEAESRRWVADATRVTSELEAERRASRERAEEAERAREQVRAEVEALAARLLEEKGGVMLSRSQEGLRGLLEPLKERLAAFEQKVEKTYDQDNRDRASLLQHLKALQDAQARLHHDAQSLARALTGESKAQGDWGELSLERLLERSGLTRGLEYELQVSERDEEGSARRPDAVLHLPNQRAVIVDAKCSLTAFVEASRAEDEASRQAALDAHVQSLRRHVAALAQKNYRALLGPQTLDSVLLFVPSEAAFHMAIARDLDLYDGALRQGIVLVSPTTLLPALQLIAQLWRSEKQNANAQRIAEDAGRLLDKLKGFLDELEAVGSALANAQTHYDEAKKRLETGRGNVLKRARDLVALGARVRPETEQRLLAEPQAEDDRQDVLELGDVSAPRPSA